MDSFERGVRLLKPYLHLEGQEPLPVHQENLSEGIKLLLAHPDLWEAHWFLGKAFECTGDYGRSAQHFRTAFQFAPDHPAVIHEYLVALLRVRSIEEAGQVVRSVGSCADPLVRFDVALYFYVSGDFQKADSILVETEWPERQLERIASLRTKIRQQIDS